MLGNARKYRVLVQGKYYRNPWHGISPASSWKPWIISEVGILMRTDWLLPRALLSLRVQKSGSNFACPHLLSGALRKLTSHTHRRSRVLYHEVISFLVFFRGARRYDH